MLTDIILRLAADPRGVPLNVIVAEAVARTGRSWRSVQPSVSNRIRELWAAGRLELHGRSWDDTYTARVRLGERKRMQVRRVSLKTERP